MSRIAGLAVAVAILTAGPVRADLMTCEVVNVGSSDRGELARYGDAMGERFLLGFSKFGSGVTVLYQSGASPQWDCEMVGGTYACRFATLGRNAVFDSSTGHLTIPSGFKDFYAEAVCRPFRIPER